MSDSRTKYYEMEEEGKVLSKGLTGFAGLTTPIGVVNDSAEYFCDIKLNKGYKVRVTLSNGEKIIIEG